MPDHILREMFFRILELSRMEWGDGDCLRVGFFYNQAELES